MEQGVRLHEARALLARREGTGKQCWRSEVSSDGRASWRLPHHSSAPERGRSGAGSSSRARSKSFPRNGSGQMSRRSSSATRPLDGRRSRCAPASSLRSSAWSTPGTSGTASSPSLSSRYAPHISILFSLSPSASPLYGLAISRRVKWCLWLSTSNMLLVRCRLIASSHESPLPRLSLLFSAGTRLTGIRCRRVW